MPSAGEFWTAHDQQRQRINRYVTVALDDRIDELLSTVRTDLEVMSASERAALVLGLVATIRTLTEEAADAGGASVDQYWQGHLLDVAEMSHRRRLTEEDGSNGTPATRDRDR